MKGVVSRAVVVVGTMALLVGISVAPALAVAVPGPTLVVANPSSGDILPRGKYYFQGQAYDLLAKTGAGVDRISIYTAPGRDGGGIWLGTAAKSVCLSLGGPGNNCPIVGGREQGSDNYQGNKLGLSSPLNGWIIKSRVSLKRIHSGMLYFYARSSVTGAETVVTVGNILIDPGRSLRSQP